MEGVYQEMTPQTETGIGVYPLLYNRQTEPLDTRLDNHTC